MPFKKSTTSKLDKATDDTKSKLRANLAGVAGEYFVAAELSRRGWICSITLRNTPDVDILVTNQNASRSATIQCKTNQSGRKVWQLRKRCEDLSSENHFYVFVNLGTVEELPTYHIVPSQVVADHVKYYHGLWLKKQRAVPPYAQEMRRYSDPSNVYVNKWEVLESYLNFG
jgi:hypothetical protein